MSSNSLPTVTNENYFTPEIQMAYMGSSQVKAFRKCPAAALAEITGEYVRPTTTALLVGSYVDAYFEGTLSHFQATHTELFKKGGCLKAEFTKAEEIIKRLSQDRLFMLLQSGEKQVVKTGSIAGVPFKIKIDSLLDENTVEQIMREFPDTAPVFGFASGAIVDGKIMRDFSPIFNEETHEREPFVRAWGYDVQGAIYQAVDGRGMPFILAAATKEETTNLAAIHIPDEDLQAALYEVEDDVPRFQDMKLGIAPVTGCGKCPYCISHKKLTTIIDWRHVDD